jgi:enamine deaminase RidA (YjgF/YER057c/UK114 family)
MFGRDDSYFAESKRIFEQWFPDADTRPQLNQLVSFVTARFAISIEASAIIPQTTDNRGELWHEQWICPSVDPVANAMRIDDVVIAPALTPTDASTGGIPQGIEPQIRGVMANLDQLLANSGLTHSDVARVTFFLRDLDQRKLLNDPWEEAFPDPQDRPPHKYVKASLPDGVDVMAQVIAFANLPNGTTRRVLAIDAVVHHDSMSLGAVVGNLLTTSRIPSGQPGDDADEQTALAFANVDALLKQASASFANVQQLTVLIHDAKYREGVERELGRYLDKQGGAPVLNVLETELGGVGFPRLEVIALI